MRNKVKIARFLKCGVGENQNKSKTEGNRAIKKKEKEEKAVKV